MDCAHQLFEKFLNQILYSLTICLVGMLAALLLFVEVLSVGVCPDYYTVPSLLKACAKGKGLK